MRIDIREDKIKVTDSIKKYVEEKLGKLDRYFENPEEIKAYVVVKVQNNKEIIEVTIPTPKFTLRAEIRHDDLYAAIDLVEDKLERQIRKNKTRLKRQFKNVLHLELMTDLEEVKEEKIVKRKHVELIPTTEEEAILQMELIDHDFYFFKNADTDQISVLYKRKDGSYGIIAGD